MLDGATGKRFMVIAADVPGRSSHHVAQGFDAHAGSITSVCFSPDGKMLVTSSSDHTSKAWNATSFMQDFASVSAESNVAHRLGASAGASGGDGDDEAATAVADALGGARGAVEARPRDDKPRPIARYISHDDVGEDAGMDDEAAEYLREVLEENRIQALVVEGMLDDSEKQRERDARADAEGGLVWRVGERGRGREGEREGGREGAGQI